MKNITIKTMKNITMKTMKNITMEKKIEQNIKK